MCSESVEGGVQLSKTQLWLNDGNGVSFTRAEAGLVGLNMRNGQSVLT